MNRLLWTGVLVLELGLSASIGLGASEDQQDIRAGEVSVESSQPTIAPTEEQKRQKLHDVLQGTQQGPPEERRLADGTVEITTQMARLCAKPAPMQPRSGVGGNTTLAAPCVNF